ncbi:MAG: ATP-binding cassette domain-containing protein [Candidatus Delongbacteria bacterium]|nr:ATP-binding cassette domain-containing protein [Candidatus Delongbacteria bacterium]
MTLKISNFKLYHPTDQSILINNFNLLADNGDIIGIIGPNGSGKTLFLDFVYQLNSVSTAYFLQDNEKAYFTETVKDEINYHLQNIDTNIVLENIIPDIKALGLNYNNIRYLSPFVLSSIESKILTFVLSLLKPHKICLVDELDSGITLEGKSKLSEFLKKNSNEKITLIISHDNKFLEDICSKIIRL